MLQCALCWGFSEFTNCIHHGPVPQEREGVWLVLLQLLVAQKFLYSHCIRGKAAKSSCLWFHSCFTPCSLLLKLWFIWQNTALWLVLRCSERCNKLLLNNKYNNIIIKPFSCWMGCGYMRLIMACIIVVYYLILKTLYKSSHLLGEHKWNHLI